MKSLKIIKKEYQRVGYDAQDIEPVEYTEGFAEYDDNGLLLREERYEPEHLYYDFSRSSVNFFGGFRVTDQEGNDVTAQFTGIPGQGYTKWRQYDDILELSDEYVTKFYYDGDDNVVKQEVYVNGKLDYVEKTSTFKNGRPETVTENDDYGNPMYIHHYEYDEKGQVKVYVRDEVQNNDRRTYEFSYNEHGDRVKDLIYNYDMTLIAKVIRTFDEQNRQIEIVEEDLDTYRRITMERDEVT